MKKLVLSIICSCIIANSCIAEFAKPTFKFNKKTSTTESTGNNSKEIKPEKINTINNENKKFSFKDIIDSQTFSRKLPKTKEIKSSESETSNKNETSLETKQIRKNITIKPFHKKNKSTEIGEDMVSKEQIKEELQRIQDLSEQATALYMDNNLEEALNAFLKIPEKYRTAQNYVLIGNILLDLEKPEDAVFMYKRAILVNEYYYKPYYNIGNICLNDDKFFMAIDYYKKAIKYAPDFPYAYYNLGCAYIKIGELNKAKNKFNKAIELKNTEPDFHYNLAYVYKKLNKPKQANIYLENYNKLTSGQ